MSKIKALLSALIVVSHIFIMLWYYSHPINWVIENKDVASFWFFGISNILIGSNFFISSTNYKSAIQLEIIKFHGVFVMFLGTVYALHYSGILITTNVEKLAMLMCGTLVGLTITLISAYRHGFFNHDLYDRQR